MFDVLGFCTEISVIVQYYHPATELLVVEQSEKFPIALIDFFLPSMHSKLMMRFEFKLVVLSIMFH